MSQSIKMDSIYKNLDKLAKLNFNQVAEKITIIRNICEDYVKHFYIDGMLKTGEIQTDILIKLYPNIDSMLPIEALSNIIILYVENESVHFAYNDIKKMIADKIQM